MERYLGVHTSVGFLRSSPLRPELVLILAPSVGDFVELILALILVNMAMKISDNKKSDARWVKGKMCTNIAINFAIGLFPVLGDIADIFYRCNSKNADLLEDLLYRRVKQALKASREKRAVKVVNPDHTAAHPHHGPEMVSEIPPLRDHTVHGFKGAMTGLTTPTRVVVKPVLPESRRFFGTDRKGSAREPDVEKGEAGLTRPTPPKGSETHNSWL